MKLNIKILETETQIKNMILENLKDMVEDTIRKALPFIRNDIQRTIADALRQEPEYTQLINGQLRAEFGIPNADNVSKVVEAISDTISIQRERITAIRTGLSGGFKLTMMPSSDMGGIIYTDIASVIDEGRGYVLPWLEWLLYQGKTPIVKRYDVKFGYSDYSRTGMAVMVPSTKNWRVPPEYAGTSRNNWTTRAVDRSEEKIFNIITSNINKYI